MCATVLRRRLTAALLACPGLLMFCGGCNTMSGVVMNDSGRAYYERGNYAMAQQEFKRAITDDPNNADYIANLAAAMRKQGNIAGAEQTYQHAISVDPEHQPSYHGLAQLYHETGRTAQAHDVLDTWAFTQPYNSAPHVEMAWLHRETGNRQAAERSLQQALKINPKNSVALSNLGQVYEESGQPQQALAYYQRSLNSSWRQPEVQSRLAGLQRQYHPDPRRRYYVRHAPTGQTMVAHPMPAPRMPQQAVIMPAPDGPQLGAVPAPISGVPTPVVTGSPHFAPAVQLASPEFDPDPAHAPQMSSTLPVVEPQ
jgi:tetratricopeptide (TPR) repeat protein